MRWIVQIQQMRYSPPATREICLLVMKNLTEADYRKYFQNMLLDVLNNQLGVILPEKFVIVRSYFATRAYLSALGKGDMPLVALGKAQQVLFKGISPETFTPTKTPETPQQR